VVYLAPTELEAVDADFLERIGVCTDCRRFLALKRPRFGHSRNLAIDRLAGIVEPAGWGLFALLGAFSLLVGPAGWLVLVRRRGRPFAYLAAVMGAAAIFSGAVLVADYLKQGISAKGAALSLVIRDQRRDIELGLEHLAIYAPTGFGTTIETEADRAVMIPMTGYRMMSTPSSFAHETDGDRQRIEGLLPVRQRRMLASRWIRPMQGRILVRGEEGRLLVENHLGRNLDSLLVWHEKKIYRAEKIAAGATAGLAEIDEAEIEKHVPILPFDPLLDHARSLFDDVLQGRRGSNRFAGEFERTRRDTRMMEEPFEAVRHNKHLIAGVY
jgi:hypothetical protein